MNYYSLNHSVKTKVIGKSYPQIHKLPNSYDAEANTSIYNYIEKCSIANDEPNLPNFILDKKAILSDVLSCSFLPPKSYLINDRVKEILDGLEFKNHKYFTANVHYKKKIFNNYFWFYFENDMTNEIDFRRSSFIVTNKFDWDKEEKIVFKNYDDYETYSRLNYLTRIIKPYQLYWLSENLIPGDLFSLRFLTYNIVTKRLRDRIKTNKINGLDIKKINYLNSGNVSE